MVEPSAPPTGGQRGAFEKRWVVIILASVCLLAGLIGFLVGVNRSNVAIRSCKAYAAPTQATAICGDGWAYAIPVDIRWTDAKGAWHDGGRPDCLPLGPQEVNRITFASVDARVNGVGWRPVIWVSC